MANLAAFHRGPDPIALDGFDPLYAGLAAFPPLGMALHRLQGVEVVAVHPAIPNAHHLHQLRPERGVGRRHPPGDGQRGARHQREAKLVRRVDHLFGPLEPPRQVL
jgi:hypothetical protein